MEYLREDYSLQRPGMFLDMAAGGLLLLDEVRLRAEAAFPFELDGGGAERPRITPGSDWIRGTALLTGELHHNGIAAAEAEDHVTAAATLSVYF